MNGLLVEHQVLTARVGVPVYVAALMDPEGQESLLIHCPALSVTHVAYTVREDKHLLDVIDGHQSDTWTDPALLVLVTAARSA